MHRDVNDGPIEGASPVQMNVRGGRRISTARSYLRPARRRPNLRIVTGAHARRIVVQDGRATGVEADTPAGRELFAATREVVLCGGAIASPHLLMLSGIGDGAALAALGIPTVLHRPAVGQNLQDHLIARLMYRTKPAGTLNEITASLPRMAAMALRYAAGQGGPMAVGATEATLFARATPGAEEAEIQYQFINFSLVPGAGYVLPRHPGVMINWNQCRPDSRGTVTLRSPDPAVPPVIHANYLSSPADQHAMVAGARIGQRIARSAPFADLVEEEILPGPGCDTDDALLAFIRQTATTVYHPSCTCRMGTDDAAVLDPALRVRGLAGLRVADASAFPLGALDQHPAGGDDAGGARRRLSSGRLGVPGDSGEQRRVHAEGGEGAPPLGGMVGVEHQVERGGRRQPRVGEDLLVQLAGPPARIAKCQQSLPRALSGRYGLQHVQARGERDALVDLEAAVTRPVGGVQHETACPIDRAAIAQGDPTRRWSRRDVELPQQVLESRAG